MSTRFNLRSLPSSAIAFVVILGIVDCFADATYEGARSITGPFLGTLGASAAIVAATTGFGEMVGYLLRSVSGVWANKTHRYWLFALVGYSINMLAVPALALADNWPAAAALIAIERAGRALRKPAVETMMSFTTGTVGRGWAFGLHTALDQAGATVGPLLVSLVLFLRGDYRSSFAALAISAILCLATLVLSRLLYPRPEAFAGYGDRAEQPHKLSKPYWIYVAAGALVAAGFADFALISFHCQKHHILTDSSVPLLYAVAMGMAAIASLVYGKCLDKLGFSVVLVAVLLGGLFAPLAFSQSAWLAVLGSALWGLGKGAQDSVLKAELSRLLPISSRSSGFGIYGSTFGVGWFLGSLIMGWLYELSIPAMVAFSVIAQLLALPVFVWADRASRT